VALDFGVAQPCRGALQARAGIERGNWWTLTGISMWGSALLIRLQIRTLISSAIAS